MDNDESYRIRVGQIGLSIPHVRELSYPLIIFEGLDKTGKSSFSKRLATTLGYEWEECPSGKFPLLREVGKSDLLSVPNSFGLGIKIPISPLSRALSHTLVHSLLYDYLRSQEHPQGVVVDRWWYSAYCYNPALYEDSPEMVRLIELIERDVSNPPVPQLVIYVWTNKPFGQLENVTVERSEYRKTIHRNYLRLMDRLEVVSVPVIRFYNDSSRTLEENWQSLWADLVERGWGKK